MSASEQGRRYWLAYLIAVENFDAETSKPYQQQNGTLIHCLARVVKVREGELDRAEGK